jgi:hypothetical protein
MSHIAVAARGTETVPAPRYVSRAVAAQIVGCSVRHLERLALEGGGPRYVLHGRRRAVYEVGELASWMQARTVASTSEATVRERKAG